MIRRYVLAAAVLTAAVLTTSCTATASSSPAVSAASISTVPASTQVVAAQSAPAPSVPYVQPSAVKPVADTVTSSPISKPQAPTKAALPTGPWPSNLTAPQILEAQAALATYSGYYQLIDLIGAASLAL